MYRQIMIPVDLDHVERLEKALNTGADLAKLYDVPVCYVGVSGNTPSAIAHNPTEFAAKMQAFGEAQAQKYGLSKVGTATYISHDPAVDLDKTLLKAAKEQGADLVVMASHVPGLAEHLFASNAGYFASYSDASVLVVR
ncbi:universal stress protein [Pseudomonas sp. LPB0260]|uniref:universal stress protein n=1 Tax=unclassified Pseudomonas TaxID=196821 RepID=UPI0015C1FD54|nr:universal stress protein [Pseudomonas sp. LPB0260]QLC72435.1 universal stress protein [Pseudomonas sp. LPB0260]QLC75211.1 universal stress protein [Pseudomonas sp. LPB0260]